MNVQFNKSDIGKIYAARTQEFMQAGKRVGLTPASQDSHRVMLVIVDMQVDFVHPEGTLSVPGATDDVRRLIDWIYTHAGETTAIAASLDSHVPVQIFYPTWWKDPATGKHPDPFTVITAEDIQKGRWQPTIDPRWSIGYVEELERAAKKNLMIWPYHTMIGSFGHSLVPALSEAIAFHSAARLSQPMFLTKGTIPQVEHYGIMEPEVKYPKHPQGGTNTAFLDMLGRYDLVFFAGEAKSHCVLETMRQVLRYFAGQPEVVKKLRFLADCTSSVVHPQIDFDSIAASELKLMAKQGVVMVKSTDGIR